MGVSFLPEHLQVRGWTNKTKVSPELSDAEIILVWLRFFAGIFHISFPP